MIILGIILIVIGCFVGYLERRLSRLAAGNDPSNAGKLIRLLKLKPEVWNFGPNSSNINLTKIEIESDVSEIKDIDVRSFSFIEQYALRRACRKHIKQLENAEVFRKNRIDAEKKRLETEWIDSQLSVIEKRD